MADYLHIADIAKEPKRDAICGKSRPKHSLVAAIPKLYPQKALKSIINVDQKILGMGTATEIGLFLSKMVVLEALRRFSKSHCPFIWHSLQALQFVCLPPFKWIQKWGIFRGLMKCMQALSKPILVLSVATSFSGRSAHNREAVDSPDASQSRTNTPSDSPDDMESEHSRRIDGVAQSGALGVAQRNIPSAEDWISQLLTELEKEGMVLPERICKDELRRFYSAANGDFPSFLTSVKKTIRWRQNFRFLSVQELESLSEMVFWHERDVKGHPCLIVRLAPACSNITSEDRPLRPGLPEVVVSQIEYGILHLVRPEEPLVTVLMDCEGLTPFRFPAQMMRSCAILLQDHYPNRLAALFVVRLPPVARVIAQTLFQVLRPGTRQKLQILGDDYRNVLSKHLQPLPSFLGGDCSCPKCSKLIGQGRGVAGHSRQRNSDPPSPPSYHTSDFEYVKWNWVLKTVIIGLLILLLCIVFIVRIHGLQGLSMYMV